MKYILIQLIRIYQQTFSRILPSRCRFYPSCSAYMIDALTEYGWQRGSWLGLKRLSKCHPFHPGGFDFIKKEQEIML